MITSLFYHGFGKNKESFKKNKTKKRENMRSGKYE